MIGRLSGMLAEKKPPFLLVDVQGVGYECLAPLSTVYRLPEIGKKVTLLTHCYIREDQQTLYAFSTDSERTLFRALIRITGVGPKMALTILSGMDVETFVHCVDKREVGLLVRLPGVGKKTAERLLVEMAGKFDKEIKEEGLSREALTNGSEVLGAEQEAIQALIHLGYKNQEATRLIRQVAVEGATSEILIRSALQSLAKV